MFKKRKNTSKNEGQNLGKQHPFIRTIKAKQPKEYLWQILADLKTKNYVFSNN
mgnify:CR=1 FL=1